MLKYLFGIVFVLSVPSYSATRVSSNGSVFESGPVLPGLGQTWIDPSGLYWTDAIQDSGGKVIQMKWKEALSYCASHDAVLPSKKDFGRLRRYLGYVPGGTGEPTLGEGYQPELLPNLSNFDFWTATSNGASGYYAEVLNGQWGYFRTQDRLFGRFAVRCVLDVNRTSYTRISDESSTYTGSSDVASNDPQEILNLQEGYQCQGDCVCDDGPRKRIVFSAGAGKDVARPVAFQILVENCKVQCKTRNREPLSVAGSGIPVAISGTGKNILVSAANENVSCLEVKATENEMKESVLKIPGEKGKFKCEADCQCENGFTFLGTPRWYSINTSPGKGSSMEEAYNNLSGNCRKSCEARGTKAMSLPLAVKGTGNYYLSHDIFPEEMNRICVQIQE